MSLLTDLRATVDTGNQLGTDLGAHDVSVTIRLEQYNADLGDGATRTGVAQADKVLDPRPPVERLDAMKAGVFGGGPLAAAKGGLDLQVYTIGPIARQYTDHLGATRGYERADLLPTPASNAQRAVVILNGPELETDAVFEIVDLVGDDAQFTLTVRRAAVL